MKKRHLWVGAVVATSLLLVATEASAALTYGSSGICPIDNTTASDCNLIVTFNSDGSIATSGGGGTYDGVEDALIGVVNDTANAISSFGVSGSNIFGFDGDGINTFTGVSNNANDNTGYGGANAFFTNIAANNGSGTVNFLTPIAANGGFDYFSLEEAISLSAPPTFTNPGTSVDEPGTILLFAASLLGFLGMGLARSRKLPY